jgi:hypothetical protein
MTKTQVEVITSVERCRRWSWAKKEQIVAAGTQNLCPRRVLVLVQCTTLAKGALGYGAVALLLPMPSLGDSSSFAEPIERRQGIKIGRPEETAPFRGFLKLKQFEKLFAECRPASIAITSPM